MRRTDLTEGWLFRSQNRSKAYYRPNVQEVPWLPAQLPGAVHLDLHRHGIIPEPFARLHEWGCRWVDELQWHYKTEFEWTPDAALPIRKLRFNGLDTVCSIHLNGELIGKHDNFYVPLEIDVTNRLTPGKNQLEVIFESAEKVGMERREAYLAANGLAHDTTWFDERAFVRKPGYMFAWDWGPRFVSCGFWQPVELLEYASRITELSWHQRADGDGFRVWAEAATEGDASLKTSFAGLVSEDHQYHVKLDRWWPHGEGDQVLHLAQASFGEHEWTKRIGLRTIDFIDEPDRFGRSFEFAVNGRLIYARGANWIPNDSFPGRITRQDYEEQIEAATKLGMNMLRVWGGGYYEHEAFYDACDEKGILVWQDFPYACSYYPDDAEAQAVAETEARANVRRLRDRTSLALWCGNNENLILWEGRWGGAEKSPERYHGEPIYDNVLANVVCEENCSQRYIASSPIGEGPDGGGGNVRLYGDQHFWDVWHGLGDWHNYSASQARFCSEFGFASSCSMAQWEDVNGTPTLEHLDAPFPDAEVLWHDKTGKGFETFRSYVDLHYPRAEKLEDWVYYSQLNQRDALRYGIEHFRRSEFCRGTLIWQMNDCWPVQSWAIQDYSRLVKPAGHELRRLYAAQMVSIEASADEIGFWLVNDSPAEFSGLLIVDVFDTVSGTKLDQVKIPAQVGAGGRAKVHTLAADGLPLNHRAIRCMIEGEPASERWHLVGEPKDMVLGEPSYHATLEGDGKLIIRVEGFAPDLVIWDPISPENLRSVRTGQPGQEAYTVASDVVELSYLYKPHRLEVRSLAGHQRLEIAYETGAALL